MREYITELSKYAIAAFMAIYTLCSFACLFDRIGKKKAVYWLQNLLLLSIQLLMFADLALVTKDMQYVFYYVFVQAFLMAVAFMVPVVYDKVNRLLLNNMCMLLSISFVILTRFNLGKAIRQFAIVTASLVAALAIPFFVQKFKFLKKLQWAYAMVGIAALGVVMVLGQTTYGSKLSFSVAGVTFQPSEFVKILFVFFVASALYQSGFFEVFTTAVVAAAHVITLVISKDLGSALIFFVVYVLMVFVATKNIFYLLAGAAGGSGAAYIAYRVFAHVQVRVQAWKDPWSVIDAAGYQITQSLFAISSGGLFGLGLYKGTPGAIPLVEADFIFSAIAEEFGIIFAICLILVCVSSFIMFMGIAHRLEDAFYQLTAFGLGATYIFQVFLTIGGGTKFIPLTGVTLPLISYGGSSVMTTLIMFAVMEGLHIIMEDQEEEHRKAQLRAKRRKKKAKGPGKEEEGFGRRGRVPREDSWGEDIEYEEE